MQRPAPRPTPTTRGPQGLPIQSHSTQRPAPRPAPVQRPVAKRAPARVEGMGRPPVRKPQPKRPRGGREAQQIGSLLGSLISNPLGAMGLPSEAELELSKHLSPYERDVLRGRKSGPVRRFVDVEPMQGLRPIRTAKGTVTRSTALDTETGQRVKGLFHRSAGFRPVDYDKTDNITGALTDLGKSVGKLIDRTQLVSTGAGPAPIGTHPGRGGRTATVLAGGAYTPPKVVKQVFKDLAMVPAVAPQAVYDATRAVVDLASGKPKRAKEFVNGFLDSVTGHLVRGDFEGALKVAEEHPGFALLEAAGVKGVLGRGAGTALRHAPSDRLRRAGSTDREALLLFKDIELPRGYSRDSINKLVQVLGDKLRERSNVNAGRHPRQVTGPELTRGLRRDVHETADLNVERIRQGRREEQAAADGSRLRRREGLVPKDGENPVASLMVEGRVTPKHLRGDLQRILVRLGEEERNLEREASALGGEGRAAKLEGNRAQQQAVREALGNERLMADPEAAFARLAPLVGRNNELEAELVRLGYLDPKRQERAVTVPAAVEHLGGRYDGRRRATPEFQRERQLRQQAEQHHHEAARSGRAAARHLLRSARRRDEEHRSRTVAEADAQAARLEEQAAQIDARARGGENGRNAGGREAPETAWFKPRPLKHVNRSMEARGITNAHRHGRGFIDPQGRLHTWDEKMGTHEEVARARGFDPKQVENLMIRPDGTVIAHAGTGRVSDEEMVARALEQDPRLKGERAADVPVHELVAARDQLLAEADRVRRGARERVAGRADPDVPRAVAGALRDPQVLAAAEKAGPALERLRAANKELEVSRRQLRLALEKGGGHGGEAAARSRLTRALEARKDAQAEWRQQRKPLVQALGEGVHPQAVQAVARMGSARATHRLTVEELNGARVPKGQRTFVPGMVDAAGERIPAGAVREFLQRAGVEDVAFLSERPFVSDRSKAYMGGGSRSEDRPQPGAAQRTGEAVREGTYAIGAKPLADELMRKRVVVETAKAVNRTFNRYAVGPGDGYKTPTVAREAADEIKRLGGPEMVVVSKRPSLMTSRATREGIDREVRTEGLEEQLSRFGMNLGDAVVDGARDPGGPYVLMPRSVVEEFQAFEKLVGQGDPAKAWEAFTGHFRQTVLATSTRWLFGNIVEARLRGLSAGISPAHRKLGERMLAAAEEMDPEAFADFSVMIGHGGAVGSVVRFTRRRSADQFNPDRLTGRMARAWDAAWDKPGAKQVSDGWRIYKSGVFAVNQRWERTLAVGAVGKKAALEHGGLVKAWRQALDKSDGAIEDLARGLVDSDAQRDYARFVDEVRGKYSKLSPGMKRTVLGYAPFVLWYVNALKFCLVTMPAHRPVQTALLAAYVDAHDDLREYQESLPKWMRGVVRAPEDIPALGIKKGNAIPLHRYLPFGALSSDPLAMPLGQLLPQMSFLKNFAGLDFANRSLLIDGEPATEGNRLMTALLALGDTMVPFQIPLRRVLQKGGKATPNSFAGTQPGTSKSLLEGAKKAVNPLYPYGSGGGGGFVVDDKASSRPEPRSRRDVLLERRRERVAPTGGVSAGRAQELLERRRRLLQQQGG